jgi:hypothetical protein
MGNKKKEGRKAQLSKGGPRAQTGVVVRCPSLSFSLPQTHSLSPSLFFFFGFQISKPIHPFTMMSWLFGGSGDKDKGSTGGSTPTPTTPTANTSNIDIAALGSVAGNEPVRYPLLSRLRPRVSLCLPLWIVWLPTWRRQRREARVSPLMDEGLTMTSSLVSPRTFLRKFHMFLCVCVCA